MTYVPLNKAFFCGVINVSLHRVSLPRTRLPVRKYRSVVTVNETFHDLHRHRFVDFVLRCVFVERSREHEVSVRRRSSSKPLSSSSSAILSRLSNLVSKEIVNFF